MMMMMMMMMMRRRRRRRRKGMLGSFGSSCIVIVISAQNHWSWTAWTAGLAPKLIQNWMLQHPFDWHLVVRLRSSCVTQCPTASWGGDSQQRAALPWEPQGRGPLPGRGGQALLALQRAADGTACGTSAAPVARYHGMFDEDFKRFQNMVRLGGGREFWVPCSYRCLARFVIYWHLCKINQNTCIQPHKSYRDGSFLPDWSSFWSVFMKTHYSSTTEVRCQVVHPGWGVQLKPP